ncbi:hypothetical protein [Niabella beijingensis]|uniref:hypothetical protein n=1 Tax=Niabella beijingensis TaxID=2872700 RepID=UPI001CBC2357|nr:hypothetical protein [Niabella beijingensis]MBZ4189475.1 hypothetical protein [Niabella beijingensis]
MKKNDFENTLQDWLDKGRPEPPPEGGGPEYYRDVPVYESLFKALNETEPPITGPSYAFPFNVIRKIRTEKNYRVRFIWNLLLPAAVLLAIAVVYIASVVFNNSTAGDVLRFLAQQKWAMVFILCCFFMVQYFDGTLVRKSSRNAGQHTVKQR